MARLFTEIMCYNLLDNVFLFFVLVFVLIVILLLSRAVFCSGSVV